MAGTPFHNQVTLDRSPKLDWFHTVKLHSAIVAADVGKALSKDGTTANQFKLAADDDVIIARLEAVETDADGDATGYGTVSFKFIEQLPLVSGGGSVVVGGSVQGAGGGEVKALSANYALNIVLELRTGYAVVMKV